MFNKVVLVGNLTRDIDLKYTQSNLAVAKSAIATSKKFKSNTGEQKEEVCFIDITFFGRSAEVAHQYLCKGTKILVEGRLQFDQWVDQNGQKRSKHGVSVDSMQMLDSKGSNESISNTAQVSNTPNQTYEPVQNAQPKQYEQKTYPSKPEPIPDIDIDDEDIPF